MKIFYLLLDQAMPVHTTHVANHVTDVIDLAEALASGPEQGSNSTSLLGTLYTVLSNSTSYKEYIYKCNEYLVPKIGTIHGT
jgi:hypothetical protein